MLLLDRVKTYLVSSEESDKIEEEFSKAIENAVAYIKVKYKALSSQNNVTKESLLNIYSPSDNQIKTAVGGLSVSSLYRKKLKIF